MGISRETQVELGCSTECPSYFTASAKGFNTIIPPVVSFEPTPSRIVSGIAIGGLGKRHILHVMPALKYPETGEPCPGGDICSNADRIAELQVAIENHLEEAN